MLKYNISRMFRIRGIHRPYTYLVRRGFKPNYVSRLLNGKVGSLRMEHLEKVCLELNCTPNDILEWIPDKIIQKDDYELRQLIRADHSGKIESLLNALPLDDLEDVENYIRSKIDK